MPSTRARQPAPLRAARHVLTDTVTTLWRRRLVGLAAETAFFALLSIPPLVYGLAGTIGFIANSLSVATVGQIRAHIVAFAETVLTPDAVTEVLVPTLDSVLSRGRADIVSIGFLISLWSGSRAISVFVDTCTIMYGMRSRRGIVGSRLLSLILYLVLLLASGSLLPLLLAGPETIQALLPDSWPSVGPLYWPLVIVGSMAILTTVFHIAMPVRTSWRADMPGAILAVLLWLAGSWLLRLFLGTQLDGPAVYGPLAAPIGIMMWLYLLSLFALIGAAFNASIAKQWPTFAGLSGRQWKRLLKTWGDTTVHP